MTERAVELATLIFPEKEITTFDSAIEEIKAGFHQLQKDKAEMVIFLHQPCFQDKYLLTDEELKEYGKEYNLKFDE
jgi:hypothetical protein